jgi:hypothetical protein
VSRLKWLRNGFVAIGFNTAGPARHRTHDGGAAREGRVRDFSIGNYACKCRFGVTPLPLIDISADSSWRGWPYALRDRAARERRNYPRLDAYLKRALGKPSPQGGN